MEMDRGDGKSTEPKTYDSKMNVIDETPANREIMDDRTRAVADQTSDVVWMFMHEYNQVQDRGGRSTSDSSSSSHLFQRSAGTQTEIELQEVEKALPPPTKNVHVPLFSEVPLAQDEKTVELVRNMRRIAEDMEQTYRPTVTYMVRQWLLDLRLEGGGGPLTFDSVWVSFRRVINAVLKERVTWGKLLLLLLFAYEIAVTLYVENVPGFIRQVIESFVRYLIESKVVKWIAEHGGWAAAVTGMWVNKFRDQMATAAPFVFWLVGLGALALGTFLFVKRK